MKIYIFHGNDDYLISLQIEEIKSKVLSPAWVNFNFTTYPPGVNSIEQGCNDLTTQPWGEGDRLILLKDSSWLGAMDNALLNTIKSAISTAPFSSHLILTTPKLDKRLKSVKYLISIATVIKEFALMMPWDDKGIANQIRQAAASLDITLTPTALNTLAESIGNNTRLLYQELEKLKIYCPVSPIQATDIKNLVEYSTSNSLSLAKFLLQKDIVNVHQTLNELIHSGENYLKILSTLTTCFRQWLTVKALIDEGVNDNQLIASAANIGNPARIYYLRKEVANISLPKFIEIMGILLETEIHLKQSNTSAFTPQMLKICS
ncbi:DNA polymerase III, delta subunit (plasmid) [Gloeothece citriformis PCC 7424]|uniref:DNA polymerase III subunit delta n=1 Tax=Gloeothece citriformis (strain PCC 7424) TaxID=65393 RepID=B7KMQ8_GLOC7|nr:DNA polymerase III subunit delta [Gloeothece citriformis]ACK74080.1 DNA polymerase III, delta subunit [Gloeothece citriformis PCC 7424]